MPGTRLCEDCLRELAATFISLPGLHEECGRVLSGSRARLWEDRPSGSPLRGMPFNTAAAEARAAMLRVLASWSGLVVDERGAAPPEREVPELAGFLLRHLEWLAAHDTAADLTTEADWLARLASRVVEPSPAPGVPVGSCPREGCDGTLVARGPAGRTPAAGREGERTRPTAEIVCSHDSGHSWALREWVGLRSRLGANASPALPAAADAPAPGPSPATLLWLSAGDIARLWEVSTGTVYRLASEQRWRRLSRAGRTFYHSEDVQRTFAARGRGRTGPGTAQA